jgi:hypothetical protein
MGKTTGGRRLYSVSMAALALAGAGVTMLGLVTPAAAQDYSTGALTGTVTDTGGKPVAGAAIRLTSNEQGFDREATSGENGAFRFPALPPGSYRIEVRSPAGDISQESIDVAASATANYAFVVGLASDIMVTGVRQRQDFSSATTGVNVDLQKLTKQIPLGRNLTDAVLLSPTATKGDSTFGNLPAIGGSSVAENAYFINGLNITNFDKYLGSAPVPFEFFRSVEVKTGGYPAEFGRATGGIINAVSKSGTNDWTGALHFNWEPDGLSSHSPDTYKDRNETDERDNASAIFELGGPIIKDRLFAYGLLELRDEKMSDSSIWDGARDVYRNNDPIWGVKLDAYPLDDHHLEFTYFDTSSTRRRTSYAYDGETDTVGDKLGTTDYGLGGASYIARYTGNLARWLTISGAYGVSKDRFTVSTDQTGNLVRDVDGTILSDQKLDSISSPYETKREFYRFDADLYFSVLGDHHVRFGFDRENNTLEKITYLTGQDGIDGGGMSAVPGGVAYRLLSCDDESPQCAAAGLPAGDTYVAVDFASAGGVLDARNTAYYLQDEWRLTPRLTLNLGVRLDQFANYTVNGEKWIDFDDAWAPRLAFSYDAFGDGRMKLFGSYGRYYLPVASNTSFSTFGAPLSFSEYWRTDGTFGAGNVPTLTSQITGFEGGAACPFALFGGGGQNCNVIADGTIPIPSMTRSENLKPSEEEEFILGASYRLGDKWTIGLSYTRRRLLANAEDSSIDAGVRAYCAAEGIAGCDDIWGGYHQYVIINPGRDVTVTLKDPINGESTPRTVTLLAGDLGLPRARRKYDALEFTFDREWDGVWSLRGSYTWSNSRGNTEGFVQSDYGQDIAGIVIDFDQPDLTEGAYGKLPNHRAHQFKLWGAYQVTNRLLLGFNASLTSPRQFSCLGNSHGEFDGTNLGYLYGAVAHYCLGRLQPRGTGFDGNGLESDWVKNLDVSVRYDIGFVARSKLTLRADIFNIFNFKGVTDVDEYGEVDFNSDALRPQYGLPLGYQQPRYVRLGLDLTF